MSEPWKYPLDDLRAAAFTLTPAEQMSLAQDLMESAHPPDPSRLSFDAWPDIVRRHARARKRSLRREAPEGDRSTSIEMPSEKDIVKRAASRSGAREVG